MFSVLWHSLHFSGPFFWATGQSIQVPFLAIASWNAACALVFIGAVGTFVWQVWRFSCLPLAALAGFDGW